MSRFLIVLGIAVERENFRVFIPLGTSIPIAVVLHESVGGAMGLGSACEVATEEQEQHDGDHRQEHCQAMLAYPLPGCVVRHQYLLSCT